MRQFPCVKISPLIRTRRGVFFLLFAMMFMLSGCCEKNVMVIYGNEAVSYYVCSECQIPCDALILDPSDEEMTDD